MAAQPPPPASVPAVIVSPLPPPSAPPPVAIPSGQAAGPPALPPPAVQPLPPSAPKAAGEVKKNVKTRLVARLVKGEKTLLLSLGQVDASYHTRVSLVTWDFPMNRELSTTYLFIKPVIKTAKPCLLHVNPPTDMTGIDHLETKSDAPPFYVLTFSGVGEDVGEYDVYEGPKMTKVSKKPERVPSTLFEVVKTGTPLVDIGGLFKSVQMSHGKNAWSLLLTDAFFGPNISQRARQEMNIDAIALGKASLDLVSEFGTRSQHGEHREEELVEGLKTAGISEQKGAPALAKDLEKIYSTVSQVGKTEAQQKEEEKEKIRTVPVPVTEEGLKESQKAVAQLAVSKEAADRANSVMQTFAALMKDPEQVVRALGPWQFIYRETSDLLTKPYATALLEKAAEIKDYDKSETHSWLYMMARAIDYDSAAAYALKRLSIDPDKCALVAFGVFKEASALASASDGSRSYAVVTPCHSLAHGVAVITLKTDAILNYLLSTRSNHLLQAKLRLAAVADILRAVPMLDGGSEVLARAMLKAQDKCQTEVNEHEQAAAKDLQDMLKVYATYEDIKNLDPGPLPKYFSSYGMTMWAYVANASVKLDRRHRGSASVRMLLFDSGKEMTSISREERTAHRMLVKACESWKEKARSLPAFMAALYGVSLGKDQSPGDVAKDYAQGTEVLYPVWKRMARKYPKSPLTEFIRGAVIELINMTGLPDMSSLGKSTAESRLVTLENLKKYGDVLSPVLARSEDPDKSFSRDVWIARLTNWVNEVSNEVGYKAAMRAQLDSLTRDAPTAAAKLATDFNPPKEDALSLDVKRLVLELTTGAASGGPGAPIFVFPPPSVPPTEEKTTEEEEVVEEQEEEEEAPRSPLPQGDELVAQAPKVTKVGVPGRPPYHVVAPVGTAAVRKLVTVFQNVLSYPKESLDQIDDIVRAVMVNAPNIRLATDKQYVCQEVMLAFQKATVEKRNSAWQALSKVRDKIPSDVLEASDIMNNYVMCDAVRELTGAKKLPARRPMTAEEEEQENLRIAIAESLKQQQPLPHAPPVSFGRQLPELVTSMGASSYVRPPSPPTISSFAQQQPSASIPSLLSQFASPIKIIRPPSTISAIPAAPLDLAGFKLWLMGQIHDLQYHSSRAVEFWKDLLIVPSFLEEYYATMQIQIVSVADQAGADKLAQELHEEIGKLQALDQVLRYAIKFGIVDPEQKLGSM